MSYLTQEEELALDNEEEITIIRGDHTFVINKENLRCYGVIDFDNDSDDMERLSELTFLEHLNGRGIALPARYNYKKHSCLTNTRRPQYYDTTSPEKYIKYVHGFLGHPKIPVIFEIQS